MPPSSLITFIDMLNTPSRSDRGIAAAAMVARFLPADVCNDLAAGVANRAPDPFCWSNLEKLADAMDSLVRTISNGYVDVTAMIPASAPAPKRNPELSSNP
jgi:hypothetical protein